MSRSPLQFLFMPPSLPAPSPYFSQVLQCDRSELQLLIRSADVAVPLMSRLDAQASSG